MSKLYIGVRSNGILSKVPLPPLTGFIGPVLTPTGQTFIVPVSGRISRTGIRGQNLPSSCTINWKVVGLSDTVADSNLSRIVALLDSPESIFLGNRYLRVLTLQKSDAYVPGFGGLSWSGSHVYDLYTPFYYDSSNVAWRTP